MPPAPTPAMALPMMKAMEFGAAPQRADPTSNSNIADKKLALMLKKAYSFPKTSCTEQVESMNAVPYQPMSPAELNSFVMAGMAVETMRRSCVVSVCCCLSDWNKSKAIDVPMPRETC